MRRIEALTLGILISVNFLCFSPGRSSAQDKGPPTEMIKGAFQEVLRTCDHRNSPYCIALALMQAKKGNLKHGFVFSGQNAYRVDRIVSVKELMNSLRHEFEEAQRSGVEDQRRTG